MPRPATYEEIANVQERHPEKLVLNAEVEGGVLFYRLEDNPRYARRPKPPVRVLRRQSLAAQDARGRGSLRDAGLREAAAG